MRWPNQDSGVGAAACAATGTAAHSAQAARPPVIAPTTDRELDASNALALFSAFPPIFILPKFSLMSSRG
jgi:hypothetical protein